MMPERPKPHLTPPLVEDLIPLERRGALTDPERRRLEVALRSSSTLRALREIGTCFDEVPLRVPGDEALLRRIAARAKAHPGPTPANPARRTRRLAVLAVVALATMASLSAAAMVFRGSWLRDMGHGLWQTGGLDDDSANVASAPHPRTASSAAVSHETTHPLSVPRESEKMEPKAPVVHPDPTAMFATTPAERSVPTAAELFCKANAARRAGDQVGAIGIYEQLELNYPASPEASLSYVVRGRIYLNDGKGRLALEQFDAYLRRVPGGALVQEALDGKARALGRLGRTVEERGVWQQLVERYPKSYYADHARRRLDELK